MNDLEACRRRYQTDRAYRAEVRRRVLAGMRIIDAINGVDAVDRALTRALEAKR